MKGKRMYSAVASLAPAVLVAQMIVRPWSQANEPLERRVAADCAGQPFGYATRIECHGLSPYHERQSA